VRGIDWSCDTIRVLKPAITPQSSILPRNDQPHLESEIRMAH
jgi:hypothetical protein